MFTTCHCHDYVNYICHCLVGSNNNTSTRAGWVGFDRDMGATRTLAADSAGEAMDATAGRHGGGRAAHARPSAPVPHLAQGAAQPYSACVFFFSISKQRGSLAWTLKRCGSVGGGSHAVGLAQDVRESHGVMARFHGIMGELLAAVRRTPPSPNSIAAHLLAIKDPRTGAALTTPYTSLLLAACTCRPLGGSCVKGRSVITFSHLCATLNMFYYITSACADFWQA